jgi:CBS domain containing-hemolysin-like protein
VQANDHLGRSQKEWLGELRLDDDESEADTIGGLVVERLGRLAQRGDTVKLDGYRLAVEEADGVRITRLRVIPVAAEASVPEAEQ